MPKNIFKDYKGELDDAIIEVEDEEDATEEDMKCLNLGIKPRYLSAWRLKHEDENAFTSKGDPTVKFFKVILDYCNITELGYIKKDKIPKKLQDILNAELENRSNEHEATEKLIEVSKLLLNAIDLLKWLYKYMGEHTDLKEGFIPSKEDMEIIDGIEEIIKEGGGSNG